MSLLKETDYGTPARTSETTVTVEIDGQPVDVPAGTSVMRAAAEVGIQIPKLCASDNLEPFGSCRLCVVDIEGGRGTPASCTTPCADGMKVKTQTPELEDIRRGVMELYISDHPLDCLTCPANGDCELQDMAGVVGLRDVRYGYAGENHTKETKDTSNPYFDYDPSKCIVKKRLRAGAKLIVADPRRIDLVRSPHVEASHHLPLQPGTNVAMINAIAHVVVAEGLVDQEFLDARCEGIEEYVEFISGLEHSPEAVEEITGVDAAEVRAAARLFATGGNAAIYYGLGVTEHSQGSTMVMGMANLAMLTGNIGREGVGVNPLRGQNNVQGSCDMGSFPHELPGYRHIGTESVRDIYDALWGTKLDPNPGLRIPNMFDAAIGGTFRGLFVQGEDIAQSDPNTKHVESALTSLDCLVVQDLFLNETARFAHIFLPGTSFLEKDGTFTNAERRINRVRPTRAPMTGKHEWQVVSEIAGLLGFDMGWQSSSQIMDEIAATTPTFAGVSFSHLDKVGSVQWPCNDAAPLGTPIMHASEFVRGKGKLVKTTYVPTLERSTRKYPLILTTGRILSQYNVGAQTRRTANSSWHSEDVLEIHPHDAEDRGIKDGDLVDVASRVGVTTLRAQLADRMPVGVVYTTFHHPESGANVVTTENSDWATNCPEYKVTAVQVGLRIRPAVADTEPASVVAVAGD